MIMFESLPLNDSQLAAVNWDTGALLVLGGPGSGKTRVLSSRIARILEESPDEHFRILALTVTNKATEEIKAKINEILPKESRRHKITTIDSFAADVFKQYGYLNNIMPDFQILPTNIDREALLHEVLRELRKDLTIPYPQFFEAYQLLPAITFLIDKCAPPQYHYIIENFSFIQNIKSLAHVYIAYVNALNNSKIFDYPSLLNNLVELLTNTQFLINHIRIIYSHVLIDEFQDITLSQYRFLSLLAQPDPSTLFIASDYEQLYYDNKAITYKVLENLNKDINISQMQLPENNRCPKSVMQLANSLILSNFKRPALSDPSEAVNGDKPTDSVKIIRFPTIEEECAWVARDIKAKNIFDRDNSVVIARTRNLINLISQKLEEEDLSVYYPTINDQFFSAPFRMLHSILRLVNSKEDILSLTKLSKAFFDIKGIAFDLSIIIANSLANGKDLLRSWLDGVLSLDNLDNDTRSLFTVSIKPLLDSLEYKIFADHVMSWADPDKNIFADFQDEILIWNKLLSKSYEKFSSENIMLNQFLHELNLSSISLPKPNNTISCFTIQAAKGMEFGHVYLIGLVENQLPIWSAVNKGHDSLEIQEERQNCYAAMTCALETLTLTYSDSISDLVANPSRFLQEMGLSCNFGLSP
jgi:DNA helicase-2/ATP-dependent DNA helicase PcrA